MKISSIGVILANVCWFPRTHAADGGSDLRGNTYCEIVWGSDPNEATVSWNGTGGICPSSPGFYDLTSADIAQTHGSANTAILLWNGIREWTLDKFLVQEGAPGGKDSGGFEFYEYGSNIFPDGSGFIMRKQATLKITSDGAYEPSFVARYQTAYFVADKPVYELVAPDCSAVYTMQSMMIGRPGEWGVQGGSASLPMLAEDGIISPPEGWIYRTRVLEEDLYIYGVNGTTPVLQDDARNTYSSMDLPIDPSICPGRDERPGNGGKKSFRSPPNGGKKFGTNIIL
ncbi:hypothetical protein IV203_024293 [Nitzschia inconspicua]|uniref:Uncharacterized protein n=1 Tax=Nitzschia inconspicua TaxID=303405 RepID=A0A9K3PBD7_9STRA|nr:hypothetical protein IV203_024293 [Nitzschia inconspicua]